MLRLTKRIDYGILILTALGRSQEERMSASEISSGFNLSRHMVANILKALGKAGIVASERGVRGGYSLSRPAAEIQLLQVIEALEGPFALLDCCAEVATPAGCTTTSSLCNARPAMLTLNKKLRTLLEDVTVSDFTTPLPTGSGTPFSLEETAEA